MLCISDAHPGVSVLLDQAPIGPPIDDSPSANAMAPSGKFTSDTMCDTGI